MAIHKTGVANAMVCDGACDAQSSLNEFRSTARPCGFEPDHQIAAVPCDIEPEHLIPAFATAELAIVKSGRSSQALPVIHRNSDHFLNSFSDLAQSLLGITPRGAARLRQHYLDRKSVHISDDLIGCSSTSEVFRGCLGGRDVAVKRLRMKITRTGTDAKELKDLMTEIDLMSRFDTLILSLSYGQKPIIKGIDMHQGHTSVAGIWFTRTLLGFLASSPTLKRPTW